MSSQLDTASAPSIIPANKRYTAVAYNPYSDSFTLTEYSPASVE